MNILQQAIADAMNQAAQKQNKKIITEEPKASVLIDKSYKAKRVSVEEFKELNKEGAIEWKQENKKNGDISEWNTSSVKDMCGMFHGSKFNSDISKWNVSNVRNMVDMFKQSPLEGNEPDWYKD